MHILITNLDKNRARIRKQVPRDGQAVAQIRQIRVDTIAPGVAEGLDLLGLAGDVLDISVPDVAAGGGPLKIGIEFDAVRRIEVNALDFAAKTLALGQRCHYLQAIAEDHAIAPVGVVLVELGSGAFAGQSIEIGVHVDLLLSSLSLGDRKSTRLNSSH